MDEKLRVIISAEIDKLKQGVNNAKKQVNNFKDQVKKASKDVDSKFKDLGTSINNALKGVGVAVAGATAALFGMSAATAEYRNNQAKLVTAFEAAGGSAKEATKTYNDLYRVLGDDGQATEAANHLAKLTTNQQDLSEWTNICQGVYATFGDSLPIEGLTEAANETAKTGALTGGLADALNWAGVNEEEFQKKLDATNTEAEREQLIRSTLNGLYSDAAAKYEANNGAVLAQNEAQAKLTSTMASLGEKMAPVVTAFTNFASQALAAVSPYLQDFTTNLLPVLQGLLDGIIVALETSLNWISQHSTTLGVIAGIIGGLVTAIGLYNTVAAVKAAMDAAQVTTLWGLVSAYTAQAAAMIVAIAPYLLIVAAIAAVIAIIVLCVKHWDEIVAAVKKAWEAIKQWTTEAVEKVVAKVKELFEKISQWFGQIKEKMSNSIQQAKEAVVNKFQEIRSGAVEKINGAKTAISNAVSNITSNLKEKFSSAKESVLGIFDKIRSGLTDKITAAKNAVGNVVNAIKGFFNFKFELPHIPKPSFGISPSGWSVGDLLKGVIPKLSIKWNAMGGVFDKPTIVPYGGSLQGLGEAGTEAIVPLEKNTKWLEIIADKLAARQANTPIVLTVDGKVFAQTSIESINQLTKQTGKLGLALM